MFVGIIGPKSSGKHTIAEYLVNRHGFEFLTLKKGLDVHNRDVYQNAKQFDTVGDLQTFVTKHWQANFIICDIEREHIEALRHVL